MQVTAEVLVISSHLSYIDDVVHYACDDEQTGQLSYRLAPGDSEPRAPTSIEQLDIPFLFVEPEFRTHGVTVAK